MRAVVAIVHDYPCGAALARPRAWGWAREARTGEPIEIPAGRAPRFSAGSNLKRAVASMMEGSLMIKVAALELCQWPSGSPQLRP